MQRTPDNIVMREAPESPPRQKRRNYDEFMKPTRLMHKLRSKGDFVDYLGKSRKFQSARLISCF